MNDSMTLAEYAKKIAEPTDEEKAVDEISELCGLKSKNLQEIWDKMLEAIFRPTQYQKVIITTTTNHT